MADIEDLKLLVYRQIRDGITARNEAKLRSDEADRRHAESQQKIVDLLEEVARLRGAAPADGAAPVLGDAARLQAAAAARAEKILKIQVNLRKSNKIKEYKESTETTVKEWLSKFDRVKYP